MPLVTQNLTKLPKRITFISLSRKVPHMPGRRYIDILRQGKACLILATISTCLLLSSLSAASQERYLIQGIIYEKESEMPLAGAHVIIEGSSYGTISGPDGSFRLSITEYPVKLRVSHIGFQDRLFTVESTARGETLMLGLVFSAEMLDAITISDQEAEIIFRDNSYAVLDFEFHENGLMLLIFRNRLKRAQLVLLSMLNDTLATMSTLPGKAKFLHRDCQNFTHYVSQDTSYQIHFTGTDLLLLHPMDIRAFMPVAKAFKAYHNKSYYFAIKRMHDLVISYKRYDSLTDSYTTFREIYDKEKLQILKDNPMHHMFLGNPVSDEQEFHLLQMGSDMSNEAQRKAFKSSRDASIEGHYLRTAVYTPIYAPLFRSDEQILIFNHPGSQIEFLSLDGKAIKQVPISYQDEKNWNELVLKDEITNKYYLVFKKANRLSIRSVDVHRGELGSTNTLYYPFVKKAIIRNGYVYFTYREPGSVDKTMLFRQRLKAEEGSYAESD